jgi:hypothetical protein
MSNVQASDYLQTAFMQGIVPLISLRNLTLEDVPIYKHQTNDPEKQRKRLSKIQEVQIRNRTKQIQLSGSLPSSAKVANPL